MRLIKRLTESGCMRKARQLKFAVWDLVSGKKEEENKCIWLSWAAVPKKYLQRLKIKGDKTY